MKEYVKVIILLLVLGLLIFSLVNLVKAESGDHESDNGYRNNVNSSINYYNQTNEYNKQNSEHVTKGSVKSDDNNWNLRDDFNSTSYGNNEDTGDTNNLNDQNVNQNIINDSQNNQTNVQNQTDSQNNSSENASESLSTNSTNDVVSTNISGDSENENSTQSNNDANIKIANRNSVTDANSNNLNTGADFKGNVPRATFWKRILAWFLS